MFRAGALLGENRESLVFHIEKSKLALIREWEGGENVPYASGRGSFVHTLELKLDRAVRRRRDVVVIFTHSLSHSPLSCNVLTIIIHA